MKNKVIILMLLIVFSINSFVFGSSIGYEVETKAYLLGDYETGQILEDYNIDELVEIASITKLLSYYVIMDKIKDSTIAFDDKVVIDMDTANITGSSYKLEVGEQITVDELIKASIVISGNDATYALAKHISGTEKDFVLLMKKKAKELGLNNAEIYNSTGLPLKDGELQNKMTTREIFIMVRSLLESYPNILELTRLRFLSVPNRNFLQNNTNPLLRIVEGIDGLKTGYTGKAGYCYVSTLNIKGKDKVSEDLRLIGIVMGAAGYDERTQISKALVNYGKDNYKKKTFVHKDIPVLSLTLPFGDPAKIDIYPEEGFSQLINNKSDIELKLELKDYELPIIEYTDLGTVTVMKNNEALFTTKVINKERVERASFYILLSRFYEELFNKEKVIFALD